MEVTMAEESLKRDGNNVAVQGFVSNDSAQEIRQGRGDPTTGEILVKTSATIVAGDFQIGAVEIKDHTDDIRVKVKTDGTDNALVVLQNVQPLPTGAAKESGGNLENIYTKLTQSSDSPLSTRLSDGSAFYNALRTASTPLITNFTVLNNTETLITIPINTAKFTLKPRTPIAFELRTSLAATPFMQFDAGDALSEDGLYVNPAYVVTVKQVTGSSVVFELLSWTQP